MNKTFARLTLLVTALALAAIFALSGCVQRPDVNNEGQWESKESFTPSNGILSNTEELFERYEEYKENAGLAFKQNAVASESDFEVSDYEGGVKINKYVSDGNIVVVPESIGGKSVLAIGEKAFSDAMLRAVSIPDSVVYIEKSAFEGSTALTTLRLPFVGDGKEITYFGHIFGSNGYSNHAIKLPVTLDMVIFGDKTAAIADNAFAGCKSLSAVVIPEGVESIGAFAFYECRDLVYINTEKVSSIGEYAFGYCDSLPEISLENAKNIGLGTLFECNSLHTLTLTFSDEKEKAHVGYFFGAESADHNGSYVPKSLYSVSVVGESIPDRAFASCLYIGELALCEGITSIGARAFYSCRSLLEIAMPESLKLIGDDAFFGCDNLVIVDLAQVESIGMQAFYGCRALKSVEIPDGVTEIKPSTFALCSSLETVALNNVNKIGKEAFWKCDSLTPIDCSGIEVADGNGALVLSAETEK